ncbi:MAG: hypothetical protein KDA28_17410, partial [Phycisphaerales bacterium]|nr:hypothetical protein [Phycisphaerales bacterium]
RIMTGAIVHTGVMWAATAPVTGCVPRFAWETDAGRRAYRLDKFKEVARAVMGRRHVEPGHAYLDALDRLADA